MKLYQLEKGQKFKLHGFKDVFTYVRLDGMYSNILDESGELIFYAAYVECTLVEDIDND